MPFLKAFTGGNYIEIDGLLISFSRQSGVVVVCGYVDQTSRNAGNKPLFQHRITIGNADEITNSYWSKLSYSNIKDKTESEIEQKLMSSGGLLFGVEVVNLSDAEVI